MRTHHKRPRPRTSHKSAHSVRTAASGTAIVQEIFKKLEAKLPADLRYHTVDHTYEVLDEVIRLARDDGLNPSQVELLSIAAAYHDAGFLTRRKNNEKIGAELAVRAMRNGGFTTKECREVKQSILATRLRTVKKARTVAQIPTTRLSRYLLDADVSNFGKKEFFEKSLLVYTEVTGENPASISDLLRTEKGRNFLKATLTMVGYHRWFSPAAKKRFELQKKRNVKTLTKLVNDGAPASRPMPLELHR